MTRTSPSLALLPHRLHLYPFPRPAEVIRFPQEGHRGGAVTGVLAASTSRIFSRFRDPPLKLPQASTVSPGRSALTTSRNPFVGS